MDYFLTQFRKEIHEQWASRKLPVLMVVMLAIGLLSPISAKLLPEIIASMGEGQNFTILLPEPTISDSLAQFIKNTSQLVMIVILILSAITIVSERERGLMTLIFPHALPRSVFVLAKFAALAFLIFLGILLEALATYLYTTLLFSAPNLAEFVLISLLLYLYLLVLAALALLASTIGKTTIAAAGLTFLFVILLTVSGIFFDSTPNKLIEWTALIALGMPNETPTTALVVSALIILAAVGSSCIILNQQEISSATGS